MGITPQHMMPWTAVHKPQPPLSPAGPGRRWLVLLMLAVLAAHGWLLALWLDKGEQKPAHPAPVFATPPPPTPGQTIKLLPPTGAPAGAPLPNPEAPGPATPPTSDHQARASGPTMTPTSATKKESKSAPALSNKEHNAPVDEKTRNSNPPSATRQPMTASSTPSPEPEANPAPGKLAPPPPVSMPDASSNDPGASTPGKLKLPDSVTLSYDVKGTRKGVSFPASSTIRFSHDGQSYEARLEIKALLVGSRTQTSKGRVDPVAGLQPLRFGDKTKSELATHFDRSRQPASLRFSANTPDLPLQAYTQDRLSVLFQLAAMLSGDPQRWQQGAVLSVHTAGPRDADIWQFKIGAAEELALPVGSRSAVRLVRQPTHTYDNLVEVWLAPELGHLPVRVRWTQANGDVVDQQLAGMEP